MKIEFKPKGVCARKIEIEVVDNKVEAINISNGCDGYSQGVMSLLIGMDKDVVIERLRGIDCNGKGTSCPDQISKALETING